MYSILLFEEPDLAELAASPITPIGCDPDLEEPPESLDRLTLGFTDAAYGLRSRRCFDHANGL